MTRPLAFCCILTLTAAFLAFGCTPPAEEAATAPEAVPTEPAAVEPSSGATPINQAMADQVTGGMTLDDVVAILGRPGELDEVEFYRWETGVLIAFREGTAFEATGTSGVLGKTYSEIAEGREAEGTELERLRYIWANEGAGSVSVDFEDGKVVAKAASLLPET